MNLHEYQAKAVFSQYGMPVPKGNVASTAAEAEAAAASLAPLRLWSKRKSMPVGAVKRVA